MTSPAPPSSWRTGYLMLLVNPFIGLGLILGDPPRWLQIVAVVMIVVLVGVGTRLMSSRRGGWRPSETLPQP